MEVLRPSKAVIFIKVAIVQLAQHRIQHVRGEADVGHDAVPIQLRAAQLQVHHVGGAVHALRWAEDLASEAVGDHEVVANIDAVHGGLSR